MASDRSSTNGWDPSTVDGALVKGATRGGSVSGRPDGAGRPEAAWTENGDEGGKELDRNESLEELRRESIEYFESFVQMFGMPRSIGQIYGVLFVAARPLAMDEVIAILGISKGSASQGLTLLKGLGAVKSHAIPGDRREHFEADLEVSRIVDHFFEERLEPRLKEGEARLRRMMRLARALDRSEGGETAASARLQPRVQAIQKWQKRARRLLPLIMSWLKR